MIERIFSSRTFLFMFVTERTAFFGVGFLVIVLPPLYSCGREIITATILFQVQTK